MVFPREWVEQRRGVIPRRVGVVAQSYGARELNARTCEQERGRRVRGDPRVRRISPRARRTSPEGAFSRAALAGRGGHQGCGFLVRAFLAS
jgi:hypothetical protein